MRRAASLLLAVLAAVAAVACAEPAPTASPDQKPVVAAAPLRIMSFNIRYGTARDGENAWPHRRDLVFQTIRRHEPDVIGLQEALRFQLDELAEALPGYAELGVGRDDGATKGEYAAILYRRERIDLLDQGTFWLSQTPEAPGSKSWGNRITRIVTWARLVDRSTGRTFRLYNVHLDHESQPSRERSVGLLRERIGKHVDDDEPVIVTGDFNAGEGNPAIVAMKGPGGDPLRFVDAFRVVHPERDDVGTFCAFQGKSDGEKIDYVFVSPSVDVVEAEIVSDHASGRYPSDHFPVTAILRME